LLASVGKKQYLTSVGAINFTFFLAHAVFIFHMISQVPYDSYNGVYLDLIHNNDMTHRNFILTNK